MSITPKKLIENIDPVPVSIAGNYIIFRYYGVNEDEWKDFLKKHGLKKAQTAGTGKILVNTETLGILFRYQVQVYLQKQFWADLILLKN